MAPTKQAMNSVPPPPRTLNVQKFAESRAPELETLHSIISNRLNNDFRSQRNKRRRTTGHDNRKKKRKFGSNKLGVESDSNDKKEKKVSRRVRRRMGFKKNDEAGFESSGDGTKRLRTHVWHAKRFTMTKLWGFHLPLGLQGRGRGSRALLKWYRDGALVHDASYYGTVQLEGAENLLLSVLDMILVPSPSSCVGKGGCSILSGVSYGNAMLHHIGRPTAQPIAPVTYMWRPCEKKSTDIHADNLNSDGSCQLHSIQCCSPFRQLWVWIHPSAFSEGFNALKLACSEKTKETVEVINCLSLEGQLAKLEVMGSKAFQLLQKILQPVVPSENSWQIQKCSNIEVTDTHPKKSLFLDNENQISSSAIAPLVVNDPRTLPERKNVFASDAVLPNVPSDLSESAAQTQSNLKGGEDKDNNTVPALSMKPAENIVFFGSKSLWDAKNRMSPPVEENVLLMERHHLRLASFCLATTGADIHKSSGKENCSRSCPIMLIKDSNGNRSLTGWSILLPLCWAKAFWVPLVSNGAHPIGQREKHWIACEVGLPYFPSDFPDCSAYLSYKATEAAVLYQKAERCPPAVRPLRVPIPPPWDCVQLALDEDGCMEVEETHPTCSEDMVKGNASTGPDCTPYSDEQSRGWAVSRFNGFVARTSKLLSDFLNEIHGGHLPFFPYRKNRNISLSSTLQNEGKSILSQTEPTQMMKNRNLCFVRVLLHAYREGVFEEEAVVCAPRVTDVLLWASRAEDNEAGLQISQSIVTTYFTEHPSGTWELQIPESPASKECYRWPIGFVTTGFVRGSKKAVACALCEATLLARLREEQWKEMPENRKRKEIYVLVRNLRSTAYRLALATVVLEQQEDDIEFM